MVGETRVEVRYAETDKMGVVYHANYLVWFEIARTKFLEEPGVSLCRNGSGRIHVACDQR